MESQSGLCVPHENGQAGSSQAMVFKTRKALRYREVPALMLKRTRGIRTSPKAWTSMNCGGLRRPYYTGRDLTMGIKARRRNASMNNRQFGDERLSESDPGYEFMRNSITLCVVRAERSSGQRFGCSCFQMSSHRRRLRHSVSSSVGRANSGKVLRGERNPTCS